MTSPDGDQERRTPRAPPRCTKGGPTTNEVGEPTTNKQGDLHDERTARTTNEGDYDEQTKGTTTDERTRGDNQRRTNGATYERRGITYDERNHNEREGPQRTGLGAECSRARMFVFFVLNRYEKN
jgi:hypothetical protein